MTDYKTHTPTSFAVPQEARDAIAEWQSTLPASDGVGWTARYTFSFSDNGMVDVITVYDCVSNTKFEWMPPIEDW